LEQIRIMFCLL